MKLYVEWDGIRPVKIQLSSLGISVSTKRGRELGYFGTEDF